MSDNDSLSFPLDYIVELVEDLPLIFSQSFDFLLTIRRQRHCLDHKDCNMTSAVIKSPHCNHPVNKSIVVEVESRYFGGFLLFTLSLLNLFDVYQNFGTQNLMNYGNVVLRRFNCHNVVVPIVDQNSLRHKYCEIRFDSIVATMATNLHNDALTTDS